MKTILKSIALVTITLITVNISLAQPQPNGGNDPGVDNTPVGGGAPVGSGIGILLLLGAAYGGKKAYDFRKSTQQE